MSSAVAQLGGDPGALGLKEELMLGPGPEHQVLKGGMGVLNEVHGRRA